MKQELKQQLKDKYKIFSDINEVNISVGDGWYDVIDGGSQLIQEYLDKRPNMVVKVGQIKEKFGEMRFYVDGHVDEYINEIINTMEDASSSVCEKCGNICKEKIRTAGWVKTMCAPCYKEHTQEKVKWFQEIAKKKIDVIK
jgi:hypothetical protein